MRANSVIATGVAALCFVAQAWGSPIVTHSGSTDPTTESPAWTLQANGTGTAGSGVTHLGEPAWKLTDPSGGANGSKYGYTSISTTDFDDPTGWTVEWRMAGENLKNLTGDDEAVMRVFDGHYAFAFTMKVNGTGASDGATLGQRFGAVVLKNDIPTIASRATAFHTFAFDYSPSSNVYRLFYDNALVTDSTLTPGLLSVPIGSASLAWGGLDGNTNDGDIAVDSYWNYVQLHTGTYNVPEPASLSVLGLGAVLVHRRRK